MPLTSIPLPYGLRDVRITPYTDATLTTLGTGVDLPYGRTFSFSESEEFTELRGDDQLITTRGKGPQVDWDVEAGGISLAALVVMAGGTLTATGTTPAQKNSYKKLATDVRQFFKVEGQSISDSGGDFHCVLDRVRVTGNIEGQFGDGEFFLTKASGIALPSLVATRLGLLYEFVQNETAVANT